MSRPIYETASDRSSESKAFPRVAKHLSNGVYLRPEKLPPLSFADAALVDKHNNIRYYIEYKKRDMVWGKYPTIMLSASKFLNLNTLKDLGVKAYFVVEDNEERLHGINLHSPHLKMTVKWGGRTAKTRDRYDVEAVCHFPISQFVEIQ